MNALDPSEAPHALALWRQLAQAMRPDRTISLARGTSKESESNDAFVPSLEWRRDFPRQMLKDRNTSIKSTPSDE
jgi:hypothetical protein